MYGARTSLVVGLVAGFLCTLIALVVGLTAGYLQGMVDEVLSFFINLGLVVPVLPLMIVLSAYAPVKGIGLVIFVIAITGWAFGARIKRAQIITLRTRDYVTAAKFSGDSTARIIFYEIAPEHDLADRGRLHGRRPSARSAPRRGSPSSVSATRRRSAGERCSTQASAGGALLTGQWAWLIAPGAGAGRPDHVVHPDQLRRRRAEQPAPEGGLT